MKEFLELTMIVLILFVGMPLVGIGVVGLV